VSEEPFGLKLNEMIDLAQKTRLDGVLDQERISEALSRSWQAMASLFPQLDTKLSAPVIYNTNSLLKSRKGGFR
jgi:hypothetical protein